MNAPDSSGAASPGGSSFPTKHWSVVINAGADVDAELHHLIAAVSDHMSAT